MIEDADPDTVIANYERARKANWTLKDIHFSKEQYEFIYEPNGKLKKFYQMIMSDFNVMQGESLFSGIFNDTYRSH